MNPNTAEENNSQVTEVVGKVFDALTGIRYQQYSGVDIDFELGKLESIIMQHTPHNHVYIIDKLVRPDIHDTESTIEFAYEVSVACEELHFNKVSGTTCQFNPDHILQLGEYLNPVLRGTDVSDRIDTNSIHLRYARLLILTFCQRAEAGWSLPWPTLVREAILVSHGRDGEYLLARELDEKDHQFGNGRYTVYGDEDGN